MLRFRGHDGRGGAILRASHRVWVGVKAGGGVFGPLSHLKGSRIQHN